MTNPNESYGITWKNGIATRILFLDPGAVSYMKECAARGEINLFLAGQISTTVKSILGADATGQHEEFVKVRVNYIDIGGSLEAFFRQHLKCLEGHTLEDGDLNGVHSFRKEDGTLSIFCDLCGAEETIPAKFWRI